jgi:hypothetical protein
MSHATTSWTLIPDPVEATVAAAVSRVEPGVDWELDDDGDLIMPLRYTLGLAAVAQGLRIRVQMFKGEWFLNLDEGLPYLENDSVAETDALFGQRFDKAKALSAFRRVITATPYVESILSLGVTFDGATRTLNVEWRVKSALGVVEGSLQV